MKQKASNGILDAEHGLVSIIMASYNSVSFIREAVESVLAQTYSKWELLIVNDGSLDGTKEFLDSLAHSSITVLHQVNSGASSARNRALAIARGEFITVLDADDLLPPESLSSRVEFLRSNPGCGLVDGVVSVRNEDLSLELRRHRPTYQGPLFPKLIDLNSGVFCGGVYLYRSALLQGRRYLEGLSHCEDLLFFLELGHDKEVFYGSISDTVYIYRRPTQSAMSNLAGLQNGYENLLCRAAGFSRATFADLVRMKLRVSRIMIISWCRAGRPVQALLCLWKIWCRPKTLG